MSEAPVDISFQLDEEFVEIYKRRAEEINSVLSNLAETTSYENKIRILKKYLLLKRESDSGKSRHKIFPNVIMKEIVIKVQNQALEGLILWPREYTKDIPCIYFIHGGGLMVGSFYDNLEQLSDLCLKLGTALFAIDYRLAPEFQYPVPLQDCFTGLSWLMDNGSGFGIDTDRIILMGESAGGALAASLALMLKDKDLQWLKGLILLSPMLDPRNTTKSSHQFKGGWPFWPREFNVPAWTAYLGSDKKRFDEDPYSNIFTTRDLEGFPVTYAEVGNIDLFRDETIEFVKLLSENGNDVTFHLFSKMFHGMDSLIPQSERVRRILDLRIKEIKSLFRL
jgi:acetyl esterase/lipase